MKKRWKKILAVVLLFTMIFTFSVRPKKADASISMTLAGIAATGVTMLPYALGAAGILAVGGVIKNWDVVKEYGEEVISKMGGYDAASGSYVQNPDGTATVIYSPAMKLAMAQAVDGVPATVYKTADPFSVSFGSYTWAANSWQTSSISLSGITVAAGTYYLYVDAPNIAKIGPAQIYADNGSTGYIQLVNATWENVGGSVYRRAFTFASQYYGLPLQTLKIGKATTPGDNYYESIGVSNISLVSQAYLDSGGETLYTADTFGTVADNVNARLLGMNAAIADGQAVTISADAELLNASIDDLASISDATLTETQTQTGILSQIWRAITSIPSSIAAAGVAASTAINDYAQNLWDDAGAIWSGMGDTLTNIQTDVNAKIGAMQDTLTGGIDNIRTDIGAMMDNLRAGIDSFAASAAANWASWGQLTLDGIDAGVGAITGAITDTWTATTTTINEGIGTITDGLTSIIDWITGFPTMFYSWFVPPDFSFIGPLITKATDDLEDKIGTLPKIEDLTAAISSYEKSIYDIEITLMGKNYKIVPISLKPTIDWARPFLTAAVNLTSITFLIHRNKRELFK